jgi:hypothetical protein
MNKHSEKYKVIKKKVDVGRASIKKKYTYFPFYDMENNSPILRYKMWTKYRDKCIVKGYKYLDFKEYGKVLHKIGHNIFETLLNDPNGVNFKYFKIRLEFYKPTKKRTYVEPILMYYPRAKKKAIFKARNWKIFIGDTFKKELQKRIKNKTIESFNYSLVRPYSGKHILKTLDLFDDF